MRRASLALSLVFTVLATSSVFAVIAYDQNVTPGVIMGTGISNGSWTVDQSNGVELGLRAKLRFDSNNQPQNIFNSNGAGRYTFPAGLPPTGFGFAPGSQSTAVWNFEWSINTDYGNSTGWNLNDLDYRLDIDFQPSTGTANFAFDPINPILGTQYYDHAIGNNSTPDSGGTVAANGSQYASLIANNNVAQNSWNMEFFDSPIFPFDATLTGEYTFVLSAFEKGTSNLVSRTSMAVSAVPEPSAFLFGGLICGVLGVNYYRKKFAAAA